MAKIEKLAERIDELEAEYRTVLLKALRKCASGQWGCLDTMNTYPSSLSRRMKLGS